MAEQPSKELTITRTFDAPRELVWKAWTDPKLVMQWWGPNMVSTPTCELDVKKGGKIYIVMLAGKEMGEYAGMKWPAKGVFREVVPQEKLVYTSEALDDNQGMMIESITTLTLEKQGSKTKMTLHILVTKIVGPRGEFALQGMSMGWNQSIEKLDAFLKNQ